MTANEIVSVASGDAPIVVMDFSQVLGPDSVIATQDSITYSPAGPTSANAEVSNDGERVLFKPGSMSADTTYTVTVVVTTNTTPSETLTGVGTLAVT